MDEKIDLLLSFSPQALTGKHRFAIEPLLRIGMRPTTAIKFHAKLSGQVAEWLKAADCKSARVTVRWFESSPVHHFSYI
jgi:hypothetical protein